MLSKIVSDCDLAISQIHVEHAGCFNTCLWSKCMQIAGLQSRHRDEVINQDQEQKGIIELDQSIQNNAI
jgi:hypothetical protein